MNLRDHLSRFLFGRGVSRIVAMETAMPDVETRQWPDGRPLIQLDPALVNMRNTIADLGRTINDAAERYRRESALAKAVVALQTAQ